MARVEHNDALRARLFRRGFTVAVGRRQRLFFAMTCDETPERVMAASPAFSTWRREASIFNGLKVLIRPELQTSGTWCYIVSRFPLRPFKTRIVLLFISIHDSAYYVIFSTSFRLILAIR
jgi:hypothetical protein